MKKIALLLLTLALSSNTNLHSFSPSATSTEAVTSNSIQWKTRYTDAVEASEKTGLPILLFFTGSDWCTWCKRLEHEVLNTPEFAQRVGNRFIFVVLDFPSHGGGDPQTAQQNQKLKSKYSIKGFPSIVITDAAGNRLGGTGYREGGGIPYADHLLGMIGSYEKHRQSLATLSQQNAKGTEAPAAPSQPTSLTTSLPAPKVQANDETSQLIARYLTVIANGEINSKEAFVLRDRLLAVPAEQLPSISRQLAVADFQALQQNAKARQLRADAITAPLVQYADKYGARDTEVWRLYMAVSQTFAEAKQPQEALKYAQMAATVAPSSVKKDIDNSIHYLQSQQ